ncbi:MAG: helix-turn-helix transcriptional regulator [Bacteroidota bacterium]
MKAHLQTAPNGPGQSPTKRENANSPTQSPNLRPTYFEEDTLWLQEVTECIQQNIANNHYSIAQLADDVAISERQLRRRLKKLLGLRPREYMTQIRLQHAHYLILQRKYRTLTQIAKAVGYRDTGAFRHSFQQWFEKSPHELLHT